MIIEPDFVDHWETRLFGGLLGDDEMAPIYLIRLWAHCQQSKATKFEVMSMDDLKVLCRYAGAASVLDGALVASNFIARNGDAIEVLRWAEQNACIVASWSRDVRQLDVTAAQWLKIRQEVFDRDGHRCTYCGEIAKALECDHVVPVSRGGLSTMGNLVAACFSCNRSKGAKTLADWRGH